MENKVLVDLCKSKFIEHPVPDEYWYPNSSIREFKAQGYALGLMQGEEEFKTDLITMLKAECNSDNIIAMTFEEMLNKINSL